MFYNLDDPQDKQELETKIIEWIADARAEHGSMGPEWDEADAYYENEQVPAGFTDRHADALADANDPTKPSTKSKQYVVINKVRESHENILGDFIGARKSIQVRGRSPKDRRVGNAIKAEIQHVEDQTELWDRVMVPAIDNTILRGLDWIKIRFNPFKNLPYGKIEIERLSCRDVMIDPDNYQQFMEDTGYRIHQQRMNVKHANKRFGEYLGGLEFGPDREAEETKTRRRSKGTHEQFCTIYEVHYTELEYEYFWNNPLTKEEEEIDEEKFMVLSNDPRSRDQVYKSEKDVYYIALFNRTVGAFFNDINTMDMWGLIPSINIKRESRAYPFGDAIYYRNLQDLMNVLMSVALENAKKGNRPIVGVDMASFSKYGKEINEALNSPGTKALPANQLSVHYPREINQAVVNLLSMSEKFIYDLSAKHAASRGELPTQQIAERTVNVLIAQDRQSHGRKDITIRWTMSQIAKAIYRIAAENYTEEHWVRILDAQPGEEEYVPINFRLTQEEFQTFILEMMGIDMKALEQSGDQAMIEEAKVAVARYTAKFRHENEVKTVPDKFYKLSDGRIFNQEQMKEFLNGLDFTLPEYEAQFGEVQKGENTIFVINDLASDPDVDIRYDIDFNFEQDRVARQNRAILLRQGGDISRRRLLTELDFPDAEDAAREAEEENQILALAKQIVDNPEVHQQVLALLENMKKAA